MIFKWLKRLFYLSLILFVVSNIIIYNHAYNFTHFADKNLPKITSDSISQMSLGEKLKLGFYGVEVGKPRNWTVPDTTFEEVTMGENPQLHGWWIPTHKIPVGVMILFHGYSVSKSSLLEAAKIFRKLGYHTLLMDFRAHGDSEGFQSSIGYHEAKDVQTAYNYAKTYYKLPISLMGSSMGAVSILKAMHDENLAVEKIILECPFGSLKDAVYSRFENMKIPTFLLPEMLLFWGGIQNKMDAWGHDAAKYASKVKVPTLVIYGAKDPKVRRYEVDKVFNALVGERVFKLIETAGHDNILEDAPKEWVAAVWGFLD